MRSVCWVHVARLVHQDNMLFSSVNIGIRNNTISPTDSSASSFIFPVGQWIKCLRCTLLLSSLPAFDTHTKKPLSLPIVICFKFSQLSLLLFHWSQLTEATNASSLATWKGERLHLRGLLLHFRLMMTLLTGTSGHSVNGHSFSPPMYTFSRHSGPF